MKNELVIWAECTCGDVWPIHFETNKETIDDAVKKFKWLCYGINIIVLN